MMNEPKKYQIGDKDDDGYRIIGIDHFAPDGEIYYITEADCLEEEDNPDDFYEEDDFDY